MSTQEVKVSTKFRTQARNNARSILRACDRAEASEEPSRAKVNGNYITVWPEDVYALRAEYAPLLKPRKLADTKTAHYQRAYRQRKKLAESVTKFDDLAASVCKVLGHTPESPQGQIVLKTIQQLHVTKHLSMNLSTESTPTKTVTKRPATDRARPLKRKPVELSIFRPDRQPEYAPKEWPLENEQPKTKTPTLENLAPEGTTLIQHVFEYTP